MGKKRGKDDAGKSNGISQTWTVKGCGCLCTAKRQSGISIRGISQPPRWTHPSKFACFQTLPKMKDNRPIPSLRIQEWRGVGTTHSMNWREQGCPSNLCEPTNTRAKKDAHQAVCKGVHRCVKTTKNNRESVYDQDGIQSVVPGSWKDGRWEISCNFSHRRVWGIKNASVENEAWPGGDARRWMIEKQKKRDRNTVMSNVLKENRTLDGANR